LANLKRTADGGMLVMTYYVHHTPGRLRVRIPDVKGNTSRAKRVEKLFENVEGIDNVTLNALTGSVVVNYDTDMMGSEAILKILKENNYFDDARMITNEEYIQSSVSKAGKTVSKALFGWAVGKAIEDTGFAIIAALI
jgi:hypothetical protein